MWFYFIKNNRNTNTSKVCALFTHLRIVSNISLKFSFIKGSLDLSVNI